MPGFPPSSPLADTAQFSSSGIGNYPGSGLGTSAFGGLPSISDPLLPLPTPPPPIKVHRESGPWKAVLLSLLVVAIATIVFYAMLSRVGGGIVKGVVAGMEQLPRPQVTVEPANVVVQPKLEGARCSCETQPQWVPFPVSVENDDGRLPRDKEPGRSRGSRPPYVEDECSTRSKGAETSRLRAPFKDTDEPAKGAKSARGILASHADSVSDPSQGSRI